MKTVLAKDFFIWLYSDENEEGVTITQETINNWNPFTFSLLEEAFKDCIVIPNRLIQGDTSNGGDSLAKDLVLVRQS